MMVLRSLIVWLLLIAAEILHGIARAVFLVPYVGDFRSRQIGVFTGSLIILAIALLFVRCFPILAVAWDRCGAV